MAIQVSRWGQALLTRQIAIHFRKRSGPSLPTWNTYRRIKSGRMPSTGCLEQRPVIQADIYIKDGFRALDSVATQCDCLRQPVRNDDAVHRVSRQKGPPAFAETAPP